jgi:hypothetical protein
MSVKSRAPLRVVGGIESKKKIVRDKKKVTHQRPRKGKLDERVSLRLSGTVKERLEFGAEVSGEKFSTHCENLLSVASSGWAQIQEVCCRDKVDKASLPRERFGVGFTICGEHTQILRPVPSAEFGKLSPVKLPPPPLSPEESVVMMVQPCVSARAWTAFEERYIEIRNHLRKIYRDDPLLADHVLALRHIELSDSTIHTALLMGKNREVNALLKSLKRKREAISAALTMNHEC